MDMVVGVVFLLVGVLGFSGLRAMLHPGAASDATVQDARDLGARFPRERSYS
jgi:Tfp pilus assembly protein PilV